MAFDLGAESGRAILAGLAKDKLILEEIHRFVNRPVQVLGHLHWDVLRLFDDMKQGMAQAASKANGQLLGIGVDTWGVDFGLTGRENLLLGNPYAYRDKRLDGIMPKAFAFMPKEEIYARTGIQFLQFNSIFQLFALAQENSPLLEVSERLLFMPDLFNLFMTGEVCSEYSIASTSQLLHAAHKTWEPELFNKLQLPMHIMPPIVPPGTVLGKLLPEIAAETGLGPVDVVAPACHDTASAVAAVPARGDNWAYLSSGTWSLMGIEAHEPIITEQTQENNFTNEGGVNQTIRFLRNIAGLWLLQGCRRSWERQGLTVGYDELLSAAKNAKPFKCIVNPDDAIFLNPPDMPTAIVEYCRSGQQPIPESKGEFVRCVLESLALKYRFIIDKISEMQAKRIDKLHIVGGGSQNDLLNQFAANATGLPVIAGPVEATAIGNILVQAIAKKELDSIEEGRQLVARSFPLRMFEPNDHEAWNAVYERFKRMFA